MAFVNLFTLPGISYVLHGCTLVSGQLVWDGSGGGLASANMAVEVTGFGAFPTPWPVRATLTIGAFDNTPYGYYIGTHASFIQSYNCTDAVHTTGSFPMSPNPLVFTGGNDLVSGNTFLICGDADGAHWDGSASTLLVEVDVDYTPAPDYFWTDKINCTEYLP